MAKSNYRKGDLEGMGQFVAIPFTVLDSPAYLSLSQSAVMLLFDICRQYSGKNNGSMSPCWELMQRRRWNSKATLQKAKEELRQSSLITVTRAGTRKKGDCELWALNWLKLDWHKGMDIQPNGHNYKGFLDLKAAKIDPIPERNPPPRLQIVE